MPHKDVPMEPDPFLRLQEALAAQRLLVRVLQQHMKRSLPPRTTHRVAFAREPNGIRAVCTDCPGQGWGATVEAARTALRADLRRLEAERLAAERLEAERQADQGLPAMWEETVTLDEESPA